MKRTTLCGIVLLASVFWAGVAFAFDSGSTGADGAFSPTVDTVLSLPADGVFNFTTVDIPSGVDVTVSKNATNTPVFILATGDVNIAGTINVDGNGRSGGNGGYDGAYSATAPYGLGPGGATGRGGGGFGTSGGGEYPGATYSNINIVPFIGGSGGGAVYGSYGGGGGGAVLIAASGTVNISGSISANGSNVPRDINGGWPFGGGGSGGAIKIVATTIAGNGSISATGGSSYYGSAGAGRIRLETDTRDTFLRTAASSPDFSWGQSTSVFPSPMPALRISSIRGTAAPASPGGSYSSPDMTFVGTVNPVQIAVSASNIPTGSTVTVSATPYSGSKVETTVMLSGSLDNSSATVSFDLDVTNPNITYVIQAYTTFTMQTAMYYEGEKVEKVMVAAGASGSGPNVTAVTYITSSGREVPAEMLMASLR